MSDPSAATPFARPDGRAPDALRPVAFETGVAGNAAASVLIRMGRTHVLCAATVEEAVPGWMRYQKVPGGWVTAEYSMLPHASDGGRMKREASQGRLGGRTMEIQRLIGRALRAVVDLKQLGPRTIWVDCDVIQADGGTRTASITGGYLALRMAIFRLMAEARIEASPLLGRVAAVSVGMVEGTPLLDLNYPEDFRADVDMNVVMTDAREYVEVQGTAEARAFPRTSLNAMLDLAEKGIVELLGLGEAVEGTR